MTSARRLAWTGGAVAALSALALAWAAGFAASLWFGLDEGGRQLLSALMRPNLGLLLLFVLLLPLLVWAAIGPWVAQWPRAAERLREEVAIVSGPHAGHRITQAGAREMRALAAAVDGLAQAHATLREDVQRRVAQAQAALAEETRRLAALMAQLTVGVVVCRSDGRILLYNAQAATLLGAGDAVSVGLGRDITSLLDAAALDHAWQQATRRMAHGVPAAPAHLVTARRESPGGALLRVQMVPTLGEGGAAGGYLLLIDDITRAVDEGSRRDALLQRLTEGSRAALANLRAAAQTLRRHPELDEPRRSRFVGVIDEEAERLAHQLDAALRDVSGPPASGWPLEAVQAGDLAYALQRSLRSGPGIDCRFDGSDSSGWLEVDSHAIVQLMTHLVGRLAVELGVREVRLQVSDEARAVRLEVGWRGEPLGAARLEAWETSPLVGTGGAVQPRALLDRHGAELWSNTAADGARRLCLQLPAATRVATPPAAASGRPIAYDFDLFNQPGQNATLDETALAALPYTVFDTETTGLRPSEGDEIISIGAVRIVNAKLLDAESFDRRVKPRRAVRDSAFAVHGISTESLAGEPPLEEVLPLLARFCEGTVLVGHNAAFDMRFLELARDRTGVHFDQPVLDTMLLAAVVQPGHGADEHHLEQIAQRLGVQAASRHQALGDAITTARVFLKLLPLLAERGITTLGQARAASMRAASADERY